MNSRHICANYVPHLREGISRNVWSLCEALRGQGDEAQLEAGVETRLATLNKRYLHAYFGLAAHQRIVKAIDEPTVDLVQYHVSIAALGLFARLARLRRARRPKPVVLHVWNAVLDPRELHGTIPLSDRLYHQVFNRGPAARIGARGAPTVIVSSRYQAAQLRAAGHLGHIFVAPNGVDTRAYRPATFLERTLARDDLDAGGEPNILYYGHLSPFKGVDVFLHALPAVFREYPQARALISHTKYGLRNGWLPRRLRELGIRDRVTIVGPNHVPTLLAAADIAVLPPISAVGTACHPNVLLECLAAGLPVVASRIGSIPEVVEHRRNALLFRPGDADDLTHKLMDLAADPALGRNLGQTARTHILENFGWNVAAQRIHDLHLALLEGPDATRRPAEQSLEAPEPVPWAA